MDDFLALVLVEFFFFFGCRMFRFIVNGGVDGVVVLVVGVERVVVVLMVG